MAAAAAGIGLALCTPPLIAQQADDDPELPADEGFSLMREGARLILRGLVSELEPALEEMQDFADEVEPALRAFTEEMGPALARLMSLIDEIGYYQPPEILPNGDIIIRRRGDAPPYVAPAPEDGPDAPGDEIEL